MLARKVKLKLNKKQLRELKECSSKSAELYNKLLKHCLDLIDSGEKLPTSFDLINLCKGSEMASDVAQEIAKRVSRGLTRWQESQVIKMRFQLEHGESYRKPLKVYLTKSGKKLWGRPRFKTKGISLQFSVRKNAQTLVKVFGPQTSVRIPLIGVVKGRNDRQPLIGLVKFVTVGADSCGTWWATITCDGGGPKQEIESGGSAIGVDLGLKHTITAANDREVIQPERERFLEKQMKAIKKASRGGRRDLPFIHRKIARRRKHSHHVQSKKLLEAAETVYVGNLNSRFLFSGRLARSASDAAHSQFLSILSYKAANAGKTVMLVNEAYTSQTCYRCGKRQKMDLSEREYLCPCGYSNDRDVNAALNILLVGERQRLEAPGFKARPL